MGSRQAPGTLSVQHRDVEGKEPLTGDAGVNICGNVGRARKLAEARLRDDLPSRADYEDLGEAGGPDRDRTGDLMNAMHVTRFRSGVIATVLRRS